MNTPNPCANKNTYQDYPREHIKTAVSYLLVIHTYILNLHCYLDVLRSGIFFIVEKLHHH